MHTPDAVIDVILKQDPEDGRWEIHPEGPEHSGPGGNPWDRAFAHEGQRRTFLNLGNPLVVSAGALAALATRDLSEESVFLLTCCDCTDPGCGGVYARVTPRPPRPDGRLPLAIRNAREGLSVDGPQSELQVLLRLPLAAEHSGESPSRWIVRPLERASLIANWTHTAQNTERLFDTPDPSETVLQRSGSGQDTRVLSVQQAAELLRQGAPAHPAPPA